MHLRLTIDHIFTIRKAVAATLYSPYTICPGATDAYSRLEGLTIGPGFNKRAAEAIGTVFGCTHLTEMLRVMGTVAFQRCGRSSHGARKSRPRPSRRKSEERMSCHGSTRPAGQLPRYAPWSPVVERQWPDFFDSAVEPAAREKLAGGEVPADP